MLAESAEDNSNVSGLSTGQSQSESTLGARSGILARAAPARPGQPRSKPALFRPRGALCREPQQAPEPVAARPHAHPGSETAAPAAMLTVAHTLQPSGAHTRALSAHARAH